MSENLLQEAINCDWVTWGFRVPPLPSEWKFVADFCKRWSMADESDFLDVLTVKVRWEKCLQQRPHGFYTASVRISSQYRDKEPFQTTIHASVVNGTRPDEEWARVVARLAVQSAIDRGWLTASEDDLTAGSKDWRTWWRK